MSLVVCLATQTLDSTHIDIQINSLLIAYKQINNMDKSYRITRILWKPCKKV